MRIRSMHFVLFLEMFLWFFWQVAQDVVVVTVLSEFIISVVVGYTALFIVFTLSVDTENLRMNA